MLQALVLQWCEWKPFTRPISIYGPNSIEGINKVRRMNTGPPIESFLEWDDTMLFFFGRFLWSANSVKSEDVQHIFFQKSAIKNKENANYLRE
jgi:hypothetical protein